MKKALLWDLFWLLVFSLAVGFLVFVGSCEAIAEPAPRSDGVLVDTLVSMLLETPVAAPADGSVETAAERDARLERIAFDVVGAAVRVDAGHPERVEDDALLLLAVAQHESSFERTVDVGPCWRGTDGRSERCDSGHAATMWQLHASPERQAAFLADRELAAEVALRALHRGRLENCPQEPFAGYAGGNCYRGVKGSRELVEVWNRWKQRYAEAIARGDQ